MVKSKKITKKTKSNSKGLLKRRFLSNKLVLFLILFTLVGGALLYNTFANDIYPKGANSVVIERLDERNVVVSKANPASHEAIQYRLYGDGRLICGRNDLSLPRSQRALRQTRVTPEQINELLSAAKDVDPGFTNKFPQNANEKVLLGVYDQLTYTWNGIHTITNYDTTQQLFTTLDTSLQKYCVSAKEKIFKESLQEFNNIHPYKYQKNENKIVSLLNKLKDVIAPKAEATHYIFPDSPETEASKLAPSQFSQTAEDYDFKELNNYRAAHGVGPLKKAPCLTNAARNWAKEMSFTGFRHQDLNTIFTKWCSDVGLYTVGENIAMGKGTGITAAVLMTAWMKSTGHEENMRNPQWDSVGTGAYVAADNGLWMVQDFAKCISNCSSPSYSGTSTTTGSVSTVGVTVSIVLSQTTKGYWIVDNNGKVYQKGDAPNLIDLPEKGIVLSDSQKIVGAARNGDGTGLWLVGKNGKVYALGGTVNLGDMSGKTLSAPITDIAGVNGGGGYWLLGRDGGVFSFGNAKFYGSAVGKTSIAFTEILRRSNNDGYWLIGADGGVFTFGNARYYGSIPGLVPKVTLAAPIIGGAKTSDDLGYWMLGRDGGIFTFGSAPFKGSGAGTGYTFTDMTRTSSSYGYWLLTSTGKVITKGDAVNYGGL